MNVDVTSVTFRGKEADATVSFAPKGSGAGAGMTINYVLERQGNRWVVKGRGNGGGMPHAGAMPQGMGGSPHGGMPPMPGLDTGKGAQGAAPGQLPPGHPAVKGSDKK
ncbi:MAG: hypothetical protein M1436_06125 [Acidobacteria bacterium]|nr:hypothetical protein [Acidobacteriota bacterium]